MKRKAIIITTLIIIAALLILLVLSQIKESDSMKKTTIKLDGREIEVELADSFFKGLRGLMFHEPLSENQGMFFIFSQEDYHGIWMANMSFSIDIVWIDAGLSVVSIERDVPPCKSFPCKSYYPTKEALYVLELQANSTNDLEIGDKVDLGDI